MLKHKRTIAFAILIIIYVSCTKQRIINEPGNLVPKTVIENSALPSIIVNGVKLHSQAFGQMDSTLVICIHGGPGSNYQYMLNCKSLAEKGYRVVFYDQSGSGLSERFPKDWYENQGENAINNIFFNELKGVISHYKTRPNQKVVLLGQSWGAMLATGYAGKYPNEINGLISAEPGGLKWDDIIEYIGNSRSLGIWSEALNDFTYLDQFISGKENEHEILDYKLALIATSNVIVGDFKSNLGPNKEYYKTPRSGAVISAISFELGQKYKPNFSDGISQFQKKVLFIYSSNNKAYTDSWAQKISAVYPLKEIIKVQNVGHSGMVDQIDAWTNITEPKILAYLKDI
jgi:proline iminopeptidase